jgi:hypothetical protein
MAPVRVVHLYSATITPRRWSNLLDVLAMAAPHIAHELVQLGAGPTLAPQRTPHRRLLTPTPLAWLRGGEIESLVQSGDCVLHAWTADVAAIASAVAALNE